MEPSEYDNINRQEDLHWWYVGMRRISLDVLTQAYGPRDDLLVLDAGCGPGGTTAALTGFGRVVGIDQSPLALAHGQRRGLDRLSQATVTRLPFAGGLFDLVVSFDVLYHQSVTDLSAALAETHRVLRPNGRFFVRVPAYDWLRGHHDAIIHTSRRFRTGPLGARLREAGFTIEKLSYANTALFPLAVAQRTAERLLHRHSEAQSGVQEVSPPLNRVLARILEAESRWLQTHNLPFGLTVIALARKE